MPILNQVSVFVGGAQKSGTRSIGHYFRQNSEIAIHNTKEGHFFDHHVNFDGDIPIPSLLAKYHDSFPLTLNTKILCDITPDYIFRDKSVERIAVYNPNATWVILLRDPIERAYSSWNMEVNRNTETLSFEDALESEINGNPPKRSEDRFLYIGRSQYYSQVLNLWKHFPKEHCHIFPAESLWAKPRTNLNKILKLMGLTTNSSFNYTHVHKGSYESDISLKAIGVLKKQLTPEFTQLSGLLGWDENPWDYEKYNFV